MCGTVTPAVGTCFPGLHFLVAGPGAGGAALFASGSQQQGIKLFVVNSTVQGNVGGRLVVGCRIFVPRRLVVCLMARDDFGALRGS